MKKGFTLIELIVVIAIISILVLLGSGLYKGYTKEAELSRHISYIKELESASERFYMKEGKWPKLTDEAYTDEQVKAFSDRILDITGEDAELDPEGKYYDIDYNLIAKYVSIPTDKANYILQNPVGRIYMLEGITQEAQNRVEVPVVPPVVVEVPLYEFTTATFTNAGATGRFGPTQNQIDISYKGMVLDGHVNSSVGIQLWEVPKTGTYKIEVYGASGGYGSKGAIIKGQIELAQGNELRILVGQKGTNNGYTVSGGGGSFVVKADESSTYITHDNIKITPLMIAGGGGGLNRTQHISSNGQIGTSGGSGYNTNGNKVGYAGGDNGSAGQSYSRSNRTIAQGGAGLLGDSYEYTTQYAPKSFLNGGVGGTSSNQVFAIGGFGGGGAGSYSTEGYPDTTYYTSAGGGGGYSGGGTTYVSSSDFSYTAVGGGGGSYNIGDDQDNTAGANTGHGKVIITYIGK